MSAVISDKKLLPYYGENHDAFGYSVAIDGKAILFGAIRDDFDSRLAYSYDRISDQ